MNTKNFWDTLDWTIHARKLIEGLGEFPKNGKIILFDIDKFISVEVIHWWKI